MFVGWVPRPPLALFLGGSPLVGASLSRVEMVWWGTKGIVEDDTQRGKPVAVSMEGRKVEFVDG